MRIRYDHENDTIEVILKEREGSLRKTSSPYVMEKVDSQNNVIAFSILKVSTLKKQGADMEILNVPEAAWTDFKLWYEMKS
jgi:hypothetical protein